LSPILPATATNVVLPGLIVVTVWKVTALLAEACPSPTLAPRPTGTGSATAKRCCDTSPGLGHPDIKDDRRGCLTPDDLAPVEQAG
jgi:hypothetical protein